MYKPEQLTIRRVYNPATIGHAKALKLANQDFTHFYRFRKQYGIEFYKLKEGSLCLDIYKKG